MAPVGILFKHCNYGVYAVNPLPIALRTLTTRLVDDAERLPELLNTAEVPVVTVTVLSDWDVELDLCGSSVSLGP